MNKSRWRKEFVRRDLEQVERRNVVIGKGKLSDESVAKCLAADAGWKSSRFDVWADRALMIGIAYMDWMAVFLIGFLLGFVLSAFR